MVDVFASIDRGTLVEDPTLISWWKARCPARSPTRCSPPCRRSTCSCKGASRGAICVLRCRLRGRSIIRASLLSGRKRCGSALRHCRRCSIARCHGSATTSGGPIRNFERQFGPMSGLRVASTCTGPTAARGPDGCPDGHQHPGLERRDQRARPPSRPAGQLIISGLLFAFNGRLRCGWSDLSVPPQSARAAVLLAGRDSRRQPARPNADSAVSSPSVGEVAAPLFDVPRPTRAQRM